MSRTEAHNEHEYGSIIKAIEKNADNKANVSEMCWWNCCLQVVCGACLDVFALF